MMESTKIYTALKGVRGRRGVDLDQLEQLLVRFSQLVAEQPWVSELDINPLLASPEHLIALDARVVLHDPATDPKDLPRLAIRPYPRKYVSSWTCPDGHELTIRPIRPEDEPLMVDFHRSLSEETVFQRYLAHLGFNERTAHERLVRICFVDYDREMALVAECSHPDPSQPAIVGVGRLSRTFGTDDAVFAVLVTDARQGKGVGTELLRRLVEVARAEGVATLSADMRNDNDGMRRAAEKVGFELTAGPTEDVSRAEMRLA
jgi:acetyltransferase